MRLYKAALRSLEPDQCERLLAWAQGEPATPDGHGPLDWLLGHCDDGVIWGHRRAGRWALSSEAEAFPQVSPPLRLETLQELRLFGPAEELLIWRAEGGLAGRHLADAADPQAPDWTEPLSEDRVLVGDRWREGPRMGFTLVADAGGSRHAVPVECDGSEFDGPRSPLRLELRHYLADVAGDPKAGAVRIAATRLVSVRLEATR